MHQINHYPGGDPIPTRRRPDVDTVVGVIAAALLFFGIWVIAQS